MKNRLINLLDACGLLGISRYVNRHRPMILMYHRILQEPLLPGIPPEIFAQHLEYLKRHFRVIPIAQMVEELKTDSLQPYSVAITFDDGHSDFFQNAWPLLKKFNLPASIYVTTGFIDQQHWLWPDLLRYLLMTTKATTVEIANVGNLSLVDDQLLTTWNTLGDFCLSLDTDARASFLHQLGHQLGVVIPSQPQAPFAPLTWHQLREMQKEGLDIGSHSVSHPILSALSEPELKYELLYSQQRIFEEIGEKPKGICYPNGMARDTSENVEASASEIYSYGLVAYPAQIKHNQIMHLGRWGGANNLSRFKQVMSGLSHNDNHLGEYR